MTKEGLLALLHEEKAAIIMPQAGWERLWRAVQDSAPGAVESTGPAAFQELTVWGVPVYWSHETIEELLNP